MTKEKDMKNPNYLGHFHRDIVTHKHMSRYYTKVTLSCGHVKEISRQYFEKYKEDATICISCFKTPKAIDKFTKKWMLTQITPRGNGLTLKTKRPKDGIAAFVWREIRFHSGIDLTMPTTSIFHLANQMEKDTGKKFSLCFWTDEEKEILEKLDLLVIKCTIELKLSNFTAMLKFQELLY